MALPFVPGQFTARLTPPLKQSTPLRQFCPPQAQNNQCDDAVSTTTNYPAAFSKQNNPKQLFTAGHGPERNGDASQVWRLQEENRALQMRLAELSRSHEQQVCRLQTQLARANAAHLAAEQRLTTATAAAQAAQLSATQASQPVAFNPQQQQVYQQPPPFAPQQQQFQPQQQACNPHQQQRRFHPYSRPQQQQPPLAPVSNTFQYAAPALTPQTPQDGNKAPGGLFAYCSGFISSSLPSSTSGPAPVVPLASSKAAPAWKFFGRSRASEDDEETGRAAPLLPLQTPPTAGISALRDPSV